MLKVKQLVPNAVLPTIAHVGDLGYDIYALEDTELIQHVPISVRTGIAAQCVDRYFPYLEVFGMLVRDRSSMAKKGIFVTGGVIDSGYTGEISVFLTDQLSRGIPYIVKKGDKIAQLVPIPVLADLVEEVQELDNTDRGEKGFGSSGG